jgi:hypothetical protein
MNTNDQDDIGVVFRKTLGHYTVHTNGRIDCVLSSLIHQTINFPCRSTSRHRVQEVHSEHVDQLPSACVLMWMQAMAHMIPLTPAIPKRAG